MEQILPLLEALKTVKPHFRVILLGHLDDRTRDALYQTVTKVLRADHDRRSKLRLRKLLGAYKDQLRDLGAESRKSANHKKKTLAQIGAGPMSHVLKSAIPLLLTKLPPN